MLNTVDTETLTDPHKQTFPALQVVVWFNEYTDLRQVTPHVATESDIWVVIDEERSTNNDDTEASFTSPVVGMALVENGKVHRIGVNEDYRRNNIATNIMQTLHEEYGELELECRESLDANKFYKETGWELVEEKPAEPENLNVWERTPET